jgi:hypothetical protein
MDKSREAVLGTLEQVHLKFMFWFYDNLLETPVTLLLQKIRNGRKENS